MQRLKQYFFFALFFGAVYFLLSRHIVFYGKEYNLLPKEELTLEYTFYSIKEKSPESILKIAPLRQAGIGEVLVERGMITDDERFDLEKYFEYEYEEDE